MLSADHGRPHGERFANHGRQSFTVSVGCCHTRHACDSCSSQRLTNNRRRLGTAKLAAYFQFCCKCFQRFTQRPFSDDCELALRMRLLYKLHGAEQVLASLLLYKSSHEENTLRCLRLSRRREEFAVDADVMDEELLRWETSFESTLANERGDANEQRGLIAEAFISVWLRTSHRYIGTVQRDH